MELLLAVTIGTVYAAAFYLLLRRGVGKLVLGIALLSQAVNLLLFAAGGLREGAVPFIAADETTLAATSADPLPRRSSGRRLSSASACSRSPWPWSTAPTKARGPTISMI